MSQTFFGVEFANLNSGVFIRFHKRYAVQQKQILLGRHSLMFYGAFVQRIVYLYKLTLVHLSSEKHTASGSIA